MQASSKSRPWLVFALVAIAQFMVVLDVSITNVAIPSIKADLGFSTDSALQWVITAYALTFGGFLLLGGRTADLFGRRLTLLLGMGAFTLFSLLIGISQSAVELIGLRALQGLAAAFMSPAALSIVLATFEEGRQRNQALGYWSLVATGGAAVGLLLGGALTQYLGWRWNFFINVPVGIIMSYLITLYVPAHEKEERGHSLDIPGAVLATSGLMALVFAISQAPVWGWFSAPTLLIGILAIALLAAFVWNEARVRQPLMPLAIFRIRNVTGANLMIAPVYACMLGNFFLTTLYIQTVLKYAPLQTGLSFLPFPIILGIVSTLVPRYVSRYGFKPFLIAGPVFVAIAFAWLARIPLDGSYVRDLLPAFILMPFGIGMTLMPVIAAGTSGVPAHESGLASGLITTSQQMGGALGLAVLSGIATTATVAGANATALIKGYDDAFAAALFFVLIALAIAATVITQRGVVRGERAIHADLA